MRAPLCLQYRSAFSVSAVSPDWDMKKHTSSLGNNIMIILTILIIVITIKTTILIRVVVQKSKITKYLT